MHKYKSAEIYSAAQLRFLGAKRVAHMKRVVFEFHTHTMAPGVCSASGKITRTLAPRHSHCVCILNAAIIKLVLGGFFALHCFFNAEKDVQFASHFGERWCKAQNHFSGDE